MLFTQISLLSLLPLYSCTTTTRGIHTSFTVRESKGSTHFSHLIKLLGTNITASDNGQSGETIIEDVLKTLLAKQSDEYTEADKKKIIQAIKYMNNSIASK